MKRYIYYNKSLIRNCLHEGNYRHMKMGVNLKICEKEGIKKIILCDLFALDFIVWDMFVCYNFFHDNC
ncbi:MAG: hypothetical protein A3I04_07150 [Nitrospinae bacterium RIFCSPLOWO2_02_FULL_39_110]|nr:MAG: hypothetical protein A3D97_07110 [Nitrospinae bacterium RIFCSPHIGHO2_12_FULL_39_42]OGV99803.1 MAG: hypothetical protein A3D20_03180 [Nitrospinae bacterium RIFCSPHIGHO2_02_FULL_39_82]OGW04178.1 MAG: hypothetical protein A2Z59_05605 [Nitrospinae bacterium RIFCSPLOWO2_02_39_17]OGW05399.1 MAG: hypothetical protein A3I04_07150 [Nitrospinae bacterium RIFCSPLOWO2_02_FULL_39_110]